MGTTFGGKQTQRIKKCQERLISIGYNEQESYEVADKFRGDYDQCVDYLRYRKRGNVAIDIPTLKEKVDIDNGTDYRIKGVSILNMKRKKDYALIEDENAYDGVKRTLNNMNEKKQQLIYIQDKSDRMTDASVKIDNLSKRLADKQW